MLKAKQQRPEDLEAGIIVLQNLKRLAFGNNHLGIDKILKQSRAELRRIRKCEKTMASSSKN